MNVPRLCPVKSSTEENDGLHRAPEPAAPWGSNSRHAAGRDRRLEGTAPRSADSLCDGLDETLLSRNVIGTIRRASRNVNWWCGVMVARWTARGLRSTSQKFY